MIPQSFIGEFRIVSNEVASLHSEWRTYKNLFATSEDRRELLRKIDENTFAMIEFLFLEHLILSICRIGDKAEQGFNSRRKINLTIKTLFEFCIADKPSSKSELEILLEEYDSASKKFRDLRDTYIAHKDYSTSIAEIRNLFSLNDVEVALDSIRKFMYQIKKVYGLNITKYDEASEASIGEGLVYALETFYKKEEF